MGSELPKDYASLVEGIKDRIRRAQVRANLSVNRELIILYWEIGGLIALRQEEAGLGAGIIPRLENDLKNELPGQKGFSERNPNRMTQFYSVYKGLFRNLPQPVAKLKNAEKMPQVVAKLPSAEIRPQEAAQFQNVRVKELQQLILSIPWGHNMLLIEKVKDLDRRMWYMKETVENGWSRNVLAAQIETDACGRSAQAVTNFKLTLPEPFSELAQEALKDPYIFDFLTIGTSFRERELEVGLMVQLEKFLLELGAGFAFVGRQVELSVGEENFIIDLLFYHLRLRCFVVIDLKLGHFRPEYAGKMNFYLNAVDDLMRHPGDKPSIGLILCQDRRTVIAEYALRGMTKPMGVSEYQLTRALPEELKSSLPSIEEIEAELSKSGKEAKEDGG